MATTVGEIYDFIDKIAPFGTQASFDNAGLLVGSRDDHVTKCLICLDITAQTAVQAKGLGADLMISHHPVIFQPLHSLSWEAPSVILARFGISAICAHTNLDFAPGGVNDCLAEVLRLKNCRRLAGETVSEAILGELSREMSPAEFAKYVKSALKCGGVTVCHGKRAVKKVGICGGAGGEYLEAAITAGADAFVTGEIKHHQWLAAQAAGLTAVAAGHFETERWVLPSLLTHLREEFPSVAFILAEEKSPTEIF